MKVGTAGMGVFWKVEGKRSFRKIWFLTIEKHELVRNFWQMIYVILRQLGFGKWRYINVYLFYFYFHPLFRLSFVLRWFVLDLLDPFLVAPSAVLDYKINFGHIFVFVSSVVIKLQSITMSGGNTKKFSRIQIMLLTGVLGNILRQMIDWLILN